MRTWERTWERTVWCGASACSSKTAEARRLDKAGRLTADKIKRTAAASLALLCVTLAGVSGAIAQNADQRAGGAAATEVPLPEVVVTAPSPVAKSKPAAKKKGALSTAAGASKPKKQAAKPTATPPSEPAPAPVLQQPENIEPPPGTTLSPDASFAAVTVATAREIQAHQGATVTDALAQRPGINGTTFAPGANRPVIRGLDTYRVRVQENGIGTHDVAAISEDHAVPVDPSTADRIEVVRGPATLRYGSQAIGGVVAIENGRIPTEIPINGFSGALTGGLSSVDDGRDGSFKATAGSHGIAVHADGFQRQTEDYDTPQGKQLNSFVDSEGGSFGTSLVGPDGFIGIAVARVASLYGIPGEEARIDLEQDKILSRGEWRVRSGGIDAVRFWFGASDYAHNEVTGEGADIEVGSRFTNREQEARTEIQHTEFSTALGELNGALGVQWGHRNLRAQSFEGSSLLEPAETNSVAAFLFEELSVTPQLRLQGAMRVEHVSVDGTGLVDFSNPFDLVAFTGEKTFAPVSVSTGVLYAFPIGVVARLTGQYVERAPDAGELFSQGLHEATGTFEIGNPNLDKERAATVEAGLKRSEGAFRFDTSVYATRYGGFIFKQLTGVRCGDFIETCGLEDELDQLLFTQRDALFYGAEVAASLDIAPIWRGVWGLDAQYDFVRAKLDRGENVPRIPPHRLGGGIYYRSADWSARTGVLHAFDQDQIGANESPTDGYTLVSAEISYTAKLNADPTGATAFTVGLRGDNLLDDDVRNHTSFKKDEVLLPGASVRLFGTLRLN